MKKTIRIISIVMCIALLCIMLCSCQFLEDRKNERAVYTDKEKSSFVFRDMTYKKLESMPARTSFILPDSLSFGFATTKDIPLLMASAYGDSINYDQEEKNPIVVSCYQTDEHEQDYNLRHRFFGEGRSAYIYNEHGDTGYYVREDKFCEIEKAIKSSVLDEYYIQAQYFDDITVPYKGGGVRNELISKEITEVVRQSLKDENSVSSEEFHGGAWNVIQINSCDKDLILTDNRVIQLITDGKEYYLAQMLDYSTVGRFYRIDKKYADLFEDFFEEYETSVYDYDDLEYLTTSYVFSDDGDIAYLGG